MPKSKKVTRSYIIRHGKRYLIERTVDGTFVRWIPVGQEARKKYEKRYKKKAGRAA